MQFYLVGGAVRDELLGYPIHERDYVVVGATVDDMLKLGYTQVGKDFPVFLHPSTKEEYALARQERKSGHGYKGFDFKADAKVSLEEDLLRRDLTINAIAKSDDGKLVDPYKGIDDVKNKVLRHVSKAFQEDPVRILRVARFAARYAHLGFQVHASTMELMTKMVNSGEVDHLVPERIWKEFSRALMEQNPEAFLDTLDECHALKRIMPELHHQLNPIRADNTKVSPQATLPYKALLRATELKMPAEVRFACLLFHNPAKTDQGDTNKELNSLLGLCLRLNAPNEFRDLVKLTNENYSDISNYSSLSPVALLKVFSRTDAFRKPERFITLLKCCEVLAEYANPKTNNKDISKLEGYLITLQKITAKPFIESGLTGQEIGKAIKEARKDSITTLLKH